MRRKGRAAGSVPPETAVEEICGTMAKQCVASRVRLLSRVITSIYDDAMRPLGITLNQINMLVFLSLRPEATSKQVAQRLHMDPSTVSRSVERMRRDGFLRALPGKDARTRKLSVTPRGRTLLQNALPAWRRAQQRVTDLLGPTGTGAIDRAARKARLLVR